MNVVQDTAVRKSTSKFSALLVYYEMIVNSRPNGAYTHTYEEQSKRTGFSTRQLIRIRKSLLASGKIISGAYCTHACYKVINPDISENEQVFWRTTIKSYKRRNLAFMPCRLTLSPCERAWMAAILDNQKCTKARSTLLKDLRRIFGETFDESTSHRVERSLIQKRVLKSTALLNDSLDHEGSPIMLREIKVPIQLDCKVIPFRRAV